MNTSKFKAGIGLILIALASLRPAAAEEVGTNHLHSLWKVEGASNVVYLLGSIHLLKRSDYPLPAPMEQAFSNSPIVVFETDIGELQQPGVQFKMLAKASLPAGETLEDRLTPQVYADFSNHVSEVGLPMFIFSRLKPCMAAMMLEVLELKKLGLDPERGVDQYFFNRARKAGKQIVPLETVEFQIGLVTEFSKEEAQLLMKTTIDEIDDTKKLYQQMLDAWKTGNGPSLAKLLNDSMQDAPVIYKRLVTDRNRRWVPKIESLLHGSKNAIVIVGAGHLVGDKGVVALLRKDGFKIEQQ